MWGLGLASRLRLAVACVVTCGWRAGKGGARDLCTPCRSYRLVLEFPKIGITSDVRDPWLPAARRDWAGKVNDCQGRVGNAPQA